MLLRRLIEDAAGCVSASADSQSWSSHRKMLTGRKPMAESHLALPSYISLPT